MRVRVLGGKTFCSRTGRMVVGEMKNKFLLVDLETVILGSYRWAALSCLFLCDQHLRATGQAVFVLRSLTWTDAHLHRQLITVLSGPVVDSFDREFRILFAASSPISETWRSVGSPVEVTHQLKDFSNLKLQKHHSLENDVTSPPSPPPDYLLDWEAMGVLQRGVGQPDSPYLRHEEVLPLDSPKQNNVMLKERNAPAAEVFAHNGNQCVEDRYVNPSDFYNYQSKSIRDCTMYACVCAFFRLYEKLSPVTNNVPERSTPFKWVNFDMQWVLSSSFPSIYFVFAFVASRSRFKPVCPRLKKWKGNSCKTKEQKKRKYRMVQMQEFVATFSSVGRKSWQTRWQAGDCPLREGAALRKSHQDSRIKHRSCSAVRPCFPRQGGSVPERTLFPRTTTAPLTPGPKWKTRRLPEWVPALGRTWRASAQKMRPFFFLFAETIDSQVAAVGQLQLPQWPHEEDSAKAEHCSGPKQRLQGSRVWAQPVHDGFKYAQKRHEQCPRAEV